MLRVTVSITAEGQQNSEKTDEIHKLRQILEALGYAPRSSTVSISHSEHQLVLIKEDRDDTLERT